MNMLFPRMHVLAVVIALCGFALKGLAAPSTQPADGEAKAVANSPNEVKPLAAGVKAPIVRLHKPDGSAVDLGDVYAARPTVLIFYRGGWCPYCNKHLSELSGIEPNLLKLGYQIVAISPDRPEELQKSVDKHELHYQLLSDNDAEATKAFGLAYKVDDPTHEKYKGFGIDLEKSSGRSHRILPVPAAYIVGVDGVIRFAHWNPDYKVRLSGKEILAAAEAAAKQGK